MPVPSNQHHSSSTSIPTGDLQTQRSVVFGFTALRPPTSTSVGTFDSSRSGPSKPRFGDFGRCSPWPIYAFGLNRKAARLIFAWVTQDTAPPRTPKGLYQLSLPLQPVPKSTYSLSSSPGHILFIPSHVQLVLQSLAQNAPRPPRVLPVLQQVAPRLFRPRPGLLCFIAGINIVPRSGPHVIVQYGIPGHPSSTPSGHCEYRPRNSSIPF